MLITLPLLAGVIGLEPMLDGRCDEYRGAVVADLGNGVHGHLAQTRDHVWLCFVVPEGSFGTLDLRIEAPRLERPLNLHASAQLGEWVADDPAAAPKNGRDPLWWKITGWWGNVVRAGGIVDTAEGRRLDYRPLAARELQLSKARFGRGTWRLSATLSDVAVPGGAMATIKWPETGSVELKAE